MSVNLIKKTVSWLFSKAPGSLWPVGRTSGTDTVTDVLVPLGRTSGTVTVILESPFVKVYTNGTIFRMFFSFFRSVLAEWLKTV